MLLRSPTFLSVRSWFKRGNSRVLLRKSGGYNKESIPPRCWEQLPVRAIKDITSLMEMSRFHVRFVVLPVQLILRIRQKRRKLQEQGRLWNKTINYVTGEIAINPQCIFQKDEQLGLYSRWPIPVSVMFWKQGRASCVCINPAHSSIGQWSH